MRYVFAAFLLFSAVVIPLACGNQNNIPTVITASATKTFTPTPTGTILTATPTNTSAGAFTATFTPTPATTVTFQNAYAAAAAPNGMVIAVNGAVTLMTLAESQTSNGAALAVEEFEITNTTANIPATNTNYLYQGFPTPNSTPAWEPSTVTLSGPKGFVNPAYGGGSYAAILDTTSSGSGILYWGNSGMSGWNGSYGGTAYGFLYEPYNASGYSSTNFSNPEGLTADSNQNIYIADTGHALVEEFNPPTGSQLGIQSHFGGISGQVFANPNGNFTSVVFRQPYAVACDTASPANIWVTDVGYSPSVVEEYTTGGVSIIAAWQTVSGCVAHGIAVCPSGANAGDIFVADAGNNQVEIYSPTGTLLGYFNATAQDPSFSPSCIGFVPSTGIVWVGDTHTPLILSYQ